MNAASTVSPAFHSMNSLISMESDGTACVESSLRLKVGGVSICGRIEATQVRHLPAYVNDGLPLAAERIPVDAKEPAGVVRRRRSQILAVRALACVAQVREPVVPPVAVDVVNILLRPFSGCMQPCKSMSGVKNAGDSYQSVPVAVYATGWAAYGAPASGDSPGEPASLGIVVKKLAHTLRGKIVDSHEALQLLIGQRPARVSARGGLRYFNLGIK